MAHRNAKQNAARRRSGLPPETKQHRRDRRGPSVPKPHLAPAVMTPSLREQAAAHRASKGEPVWRARALLAKNVHAFKKNRRAAKESLKSSNAAAAGPRIDRAAHLARRSERLAKLAVKYGH